jgi:hypothetical protein
MVQRWYWKAQRRGEKNDKKSKRKDSTKAEGIGDFPSSIEP